MNKEESYLGENVKRLRKLAGMSQRDLSFDSGVASNIIERIESGKSNPTIRTVKKIATSLNVEMWELFRPKQYAQ